LVTSYTVSAWQVGSPWSSIQSDSTGYFYFPFLPAGSYIFQATPLVPDANGVLGFPGYAPSTSDWQSATVYRLDSGDVQIIDIVLPDPTPLIGRDSLEGVVVFDSTIVSNLRSSYTMPFNFKDARIVVTNSITGKVIAVTTLDSNGHWKIKGITQGSYAIRVEYPKVMTTVANITIPGTSAVNFSMRNGGVVTSLETAITNRILIYPNPCRDFINIYSNKAPSSIEVYNTTGQIVHKTLNCSENQTLNLSNIPSGLYTILVRHSDGVEKVRLVIE
jgi:hypothetical protein